MKNTPNRNKAAAILRAFLDARREMKTDTFYFLPTCLIESTREMRRDCWRAFVNVRADMIEAPDAIVSHSHGQEEKAVAVNPGGWFGKAFALSLPLGNFGVCYIVEADTLQDAIDTFSESKYGQMIRVDSEDVTEETSYDGKGQPYNTDEMHAEEKPRFVYRCEGLPDLSPVAYYERLNRYADAQHS